MAREHEPDTNMIVSGFLSDLAAIQTIREKRNAYRRSAVIVRRLDDPIEMYRDGHAALRRIPGIGPSSTRVTLEVLDTGGSPTVEAAVAASSRAADVAASRAARSNFLSRARVRAVLADGKLRGADLSAYRGDLQMHSTWSDGRQTLEDIVATGISRGYAFAAVTDHSAGLAIAGGVSIERFVEQHKAIDRLNATHKGRFRLFKGVEANITADGEVDIAPADRHRFDFVLAAPHARLRSDDDQTPRLLAAVTSPGIHILAHPSGRKYGERPGMVVNWPKVFAAAARHDVAIEIDGDPSRQDLNFDLVRDAVKAGCLFALDSDAHSTDEWVYAETAVAHARLAGLPADRVINCWDVKKLGAWAEKT